MNLFPLTTAEIGEAFDLDRYLRFGGLPSILLADYPQQELDAYVGLYLDEEIKMEGLVRQLRPFSHFLQVAGLSNGKIINFSKIANEVGVSSPSVREYFQILEDTLVGYMVPLWRKTPTRKPSSSSRFYFFDPGVANTLAGIQALDPASDLYGRCFEQFIFMEIKSWLTYRRKRLSLSYWQKTNFCEVDFVIADKIAIEVKATTRLNADDFVGLRSIVDEIPVKQRILVSKDPVAMVRDGILCLPWKDFCKRLWSNDLFELEIQ